MIWKRLKFLWLLSGKPFFIDSVSKSLKSNEEKIYLIEKYFKNESDFKTMKKDINSIKQSVVISYKKRDPIKEIVGDETAL